MSGPFSFPDNHDQETKEMPEDGDCDESDDGDEEDADDPIWTSARHARKA